MVMKAKYQRLVLALFALTAILGAGVLIASALREEAAYFYAPADVREKGVAAGRAIRLGGMVAPGSLHKLPDGVTIRFDVTDGKQADGGAADGGASVPVRFTGIAPDLFREGSGVVAEGAFDARGVFIATNLLAKHDERYMPRELEGLNYTMTSHEMKAR